MLPISFQSSYLNWLFDSLRFMATMLRSRHLQRCTIVPFTYIPMVQVNFAQAFEDFFILVAHCLMLASISSLTCLLLLQSPLTFFKEAITQMFLQLG